ncbi:MAG: response regulator [Deltaproteobacteria bacterium]|nr:response regulator [Deltaproteobacteria bacterium]
MTATSEHKVLIVDDELDFAETVVECLELRGFHAKSAGDANEAMALIKSGWRPEVVILDLKMPGVNGLEALNLIKAHDPSIQVIIATSHGSTSDGIEGMHRGLFDYLMKPVEINELVRMINEAIAQNATRRGGPAEE